jgi:hypothetical protein
MCADVLAEREQLGRPELPDLLQPRGCFAQGLGPEAADASPAIAGCRELLDDPAAAEQPEVAADRGTADAEQAGQVGGTAGAFRQQHDDPPACPVTKEIQGRRARRRAPPADGQMINHCVNH